MSENRTIIELRLNGTRPGLAQAARCIMAFGLVGLSMMTSAEMLLIERAGANVEYRQSSDGAWVPLTAGSTLAVPVEVRTLENSEALISQAGSTFTLKSNTQLSFSGANADRAGLVARVKQWIGTAFYKIERQPDEFSVETPFLVSTVKGTQFVIVTTEADSFVTLTEGSLQVLDLETGTTQMIAPGEIAGSSAGQTSARTFNKQAPQSSASVNSVDNPSPAGQQRGPSEQTSEKAAGKPAAKAAAAPGQTGAPGLQTAPGLKTAPGLRGNAARGAERGADDRPGRGLGRDRGRGFTAALEALDQERSDQAQTRHQRSQRPVTAEDIKDARANANKDRKGPGEHKPGTGKPGSGNDKPDAGKPGSGKPGQGGDKPGGGKPGSGKPGQGGDKPGGSKPGSGKPGSGKPGAGKPGSGGDKPNPGKPGGPQPKPKGPG